MARYIDADKLLADILDERIINKTEKAQTVLKHFEIMVNRQPTADVVPKSEVEELKGELAIAERHEKDARALFKDAVIQLQNARQEVAREIFEEIEKFARRPFPESKAVYVIKEREFAELKKKYTGGE